MKNANAKPTTYVNVNDGTPSISTIDAPTTMSEVCLLMRRVADTLEAAARDGIAPAPRLLYTDGELREVRKMQAIAHVQRLEAGR